jgi:hypothetical protein
MSSPQAPSSPIKSPMNKHLINVAMSPLLTMERNKLTRSSSAMCEVRMVCTCITFTVWYLSQASCFRYFIAKTCACIILYCVCVFHFICFFAGLFICNCNTHTMLPCCIYYIRKCKCKYTHFIFAPFHVHNSFENICCQIRN